MGKDKHRPLDRVNWRDGNEIEGPGWKRPADSRRLCTE